MNKEEQIAVEAEKFMLNNTELAHGEISVSSTKPDKRIAITAFIFSILGLLFVPFAALIGIILGHISSSEKYEHKHNKLSKAAIILGYIHIGFIIFISLGLIIARAIMADF